MAKLEWVILCERAIVEAQLNIVSLVSLIENVLLVAPLPEGEEGGQKIMVPYRFYAVQQWVRSNQRIGETVEGRIVFKAPNGKSYGFMDFDVDLTKTPKARVITQSMGFPLLGAGTYKCVVQIKRGRSWRSVGEAEFNVIITSAPPADSLDSKKH